MAEIYSAQLNPGKLDVVTTWLTAQDFADGLDLESAPLEAVSSYRFDDANGKVGLEVHIVASGDQYFQVPLTYREAALEGADEHFIANMDHSVLGRRWVYAGMGDPVFRDRLDAAIATAATSAKQYRIDDEGNRGEEITEVAHVFGTGPLSGAEDVELLHQLTLESPAEGSEGGLLLGRWPGQDTPVVLAVMV